MPSSPRTRRTLCCLAALVAGSLLPLTHNHAAVINFGNGDSIALDQPRVVAQFEDALGNIIPGSGLLGDSAYTFIADTGATGIFLAKGAHLDLENLVYDLDLYETPYRYFEQGVAGVQEVGLTSSYTVRASGMAGFFNANPPPGDVGTQQVTGMHMLTAPDLDLGSFAGIIGMPGMVGRTMVFDLSNMSPLDVVATGYASSPAAVPAVAGTSYSFDFDKLSFDPAGGKANPGDPDPANESLPTLSVGASLGTNTITGTYLFDTGAQLSMIGAATATSLGINIDPNDPNNDILDYLPVGGVGGQTEVPLVQIDEFRLTTGDGSDTLVFENLLVGVIDIDGLPVDGILGYNIFTSGYLASILAALNDPLSADAQKDGAVLQMALDFTTDDWTMTLVTNDAYDPAQNETTATDELSDTSALVSIPASYALFAWPQFAIPEPTSAAALLPLLTLHRRRR